MFTLKMDDNLFVVSILIEDITTIDTVMIMSVTRVAKMIARLSGCILYGLCVPDMSAFSAPFFTHR